MVSIATSEFRCSIISTISTVRREQEQVPIKSAVCLKANTPDPLGFLKLL
jgi:hypothetical protein